VQHLPVLSIEHLSVEYRSRRGKVQAVRDVSLDVFRGETVAIIGESGCGKTTLALSLVRLLPRTASVVVGSITFHGNAQKVDVLKLGKRQLRAYRWRDCAMVFQSALNALNPVLRIRSQVMDTAHAHGERDDKKIEQRALSLFEQVRLDPDRVYNAYPHELSGGMRQRVLLAIGVLLNPQLVILDEPTTALDVLTQRTIIEVLKRLRDEMGFSLVFISHDLPLAAELAHRVVTMYAGQVVEIGPVNPVFYSPIHPYTLGLLKAAPGLSAERNQLASIPGAPPDLIHLPPGCKFQPRCPFATEICVQQDPLLELHDVDHASACHHWEEPAKVRAGEVSRSREQENA
jgi:peptide/nickel transport system ATP-binding protein